MVSPLAVATTVTSAGVVLAPVGVEAVGTVDGAVYDAVLRPVEVIVPHVGLHVARFGSVVVEVAVDCVSSHVTPKFCRSLVRTTVKVCGSLVATVAVLGVNVRPMPEFSVSFTFPVLVVSC